MKLAGIILIIIGVLALVYQGITYTTTKKDVDLGPIQVQHQEEHSIPFPPSLELCVSPGASPLSC